jgi:hypothetical protein
MKSTMSVQVDTDTLLRLMKQLRNRGGAQDVSDAIGSAIELWLTGQAALQSGADPASVRGYQWKTLFLPEGTVLRSWSYGDYNYARVEGDRIMHDGRSVSPNEFAQMFARSTRNAWTDLYIRRPEDKHFKLASRLRQELTNEAKSQRSIGPAVPATLATLAVMPPAPAARVAARVASPAATASSDHPRDTTPGAGWNLPERRKFRFRLEDVAFD